MSVTIEQTGRPAAAAAVKANHLGLEKAAYKGAPSTLCKGCGHDTIGQRIMNVAWELGLDQTQVVKMSGIGCSPQVARLLPGLEPCVQRRARPHAGRSPPARRWPTAT